jgi:long-subunit acyl-CoA synthetase (AMP-forming)
MGGIAVPIFAWFKKDTAELLITHSDAKYLTIAGEFQLNNISNSLGLKSIIYFDKNLPANRFNNMACFEDLLKPNNLLKDCLDYDANEDAICLNIYTSGTMGTPKGVQLTHKNILSQQDSLDKIEWWDINENDRFLSYLPWHHSFGGIFELFNVLWNGACYSLESSYGKDPKIILENWKLIKPTVFFSVPKIYQTLYDLTKENNESANELFHKELKFVFTAAASLPENLSKEFEKRGIPVIEGWGLSETAPCCTLTKPNLKREVGVVGMPLPGVSIALADSNEILVKGPNIMVGYYKNDEANKEIFTEDGWFRTGDIGEFTPNGLKLITRKDRIFKLLNGEKVIPTDMETLIHAKCHYISFAIVMGNGKEYPVALLFPNKRMLENSLFELSPLDGCFCPKNIDELGMCLHGCLQDANTELGQNFAKIRSALIIDDELSIEKNTLTPSLKVAPNSVLNIYKAHLENLYGNDNKLDHEVYMIKLDQFKN